MAVKTALARLEEIQTAITAVMTGGQSYRMGNQTFTRADLPTLYAMEKEARAAYYQETNGPARNQVRFRDPL